MRCWRASPPQRRKAMRQPAVAAVRCTGCTPSFFQDPTLFQDQSKSFRAKFGSDDDFAGGMQGKLGKMD